MKNTWTLLVYADGNNELEPEMTGALHDLIDNSKHCGVNIAIEIGRMNREIAYILRPDESFKSEPEAWAGVRRYIIQDGHIQLMEDISEVNMTDPKEIYSFITWGMDNFNSEHYMLVIGGHGSSFTGMVTDYSKNMPYGLSTIGVCNAINKIILDKGRFIDILLLDMCYMNVVEVMYEFGKAVRNTVKNIITYTGYGPMSGISYFDLLDILKNNKEAAPDSLLRAVINNMELSLAGYKIDHGKLLKIKKLASDAAYSYLIYCHEKKLNIDPSVLKKYTSKDKPWSKYMLALHKAMSEIIIDYNRSFYNGRNITEIICSNLEKLAPEYLKMSFAKNNYWSYIVSAAPIDSELSYTCREIIYESKILTFNSLYTLILINMKFDQDKAKEIFMKLIKFKSWTL